MIRENEPRAISLGYQVNRYKLLAFVLSRSLSGLKEIGCKSAWTVHISPLFWSIE